MPEPTANENKESPQETVDDAAGHPVSDGGSKATPEGIVPLFFSGKSQEIFGCVADTDLTPENPHKLVLKEKIVEDFKNRAAVSDFFPVKQKVLNYPGEELLLVYDYDFKFGENFYICLTKEAKDWVLNPPADEVVGDEGGQGVEGEEEEEGIPPTPVPKEWDCLGSDLEIKEGFMEPGRPLLHFKISRKRCHFGTPYIFTDYTASDHPETCAEVAPQENPNFELQRLECDVAVQAVMDQTDATSQTEWRKPCNAAVQYSPRGISDEEAESIWQGSPMKEFLNQVCPRLEVYLQQNSILDLFIDDYKALSDTDGITGNKSDTNLKEYQSFTDLRFSKDKIITWIDWHPTIKGIVAVSCGDSYSFNERIDLSFVQSNFLILIWSFVDPIHPQLFLEAPDTVRCFQFNPSNPNIIVGGCANGQIVLWNIEDYQDRLQLNKSTDPMESRSMAANLAIFDTDPKLDHAPIVLYCASSAIKEGHSMAVSDVQWIPSQIQLCQKTVKVLENQSQKCNQIISSSIDGSVLFWDIRPSLQKKANEANKQKAVVISDQPFSYLDLTWKPFLKIPMPRSQFPGNFAATRVSIKEKRERNQPNVGERASEGGEADGQNEADKVIEDASTKFFVATEDGEVVYSDWIPTRDSESGKFIASPPESSFSVHCGAVSCLERSPFFRDVLLSVGGWNFALWKEGAKSDALFKSCSSTVPLTGGAWSPTRPGVFFVTKQNGNVDVWDLLDRSHEPLLAQNISTMSITSIYPWQLTSKQQVLAVGDSSGTLHILEVPWSLSHTSTNEESIMEAFFDREVQRLNFTTQRMDDRVREKKALDTAKVEAVATEENKPVETVRDGESWEEKMKKEYDDYLTMEVKMLIKLGIIQPQNEPEN